MSHEQFENIINFESWGLSLVAYKKSKCSIEKLTSSTKIFPLNDNKLFCHTYTDSTQIKVIDSSSSGNKLYSASAVNSMTSILVHISERHKIKSLP